LPFFRLMITTTKMTATELLSHFVSKDRDGKRYWCTTDKVPQEVIDLILDCHDEELPNDWRYDVIVSLLFDIKNTKDLDSDKLSDIADGQVDAYNSDLAQWLAYMPARSAYIDAARDDFGGLDNDIYKQIQAGQYVCIKDMAHKLVAFLEIEV
jgi:hypothetical protein